MKLQNPTGTQFTSGEQTNGGIEDNPALPLMSEEGKKLAAKTAPQSATANSATMSSGGPANPLQDSLHPIFRRK
jgi:hypothetical protein